MARAYKRNSHGEFAGGGGGGSAGSGKAVKAGLKAPAAAPTHGEKVAKAQAAHDSARAAYHANTHGPGTPQYSKAYNRMVRTDSALSKAKKGLT